MTMTALSGATAGQGEGGGLRQPHQLGQRPGRRPRPTIEPQSWYTLEDVAAHYDLPKTTARELLAAGMIPATKVGRGWRVYGADILAEDARRRSEAQQPPRLAQHPHSRPTRPDPVATDERASDATTTD